METKISDSGERIVVILRRRSSSNAFSPVLFGCFTREVFAERKVRKRLPKSLDRRSYREIVRRGDSNVEIKCAVDLDEA